MFQRSLFVFRRDLRLEDNTGLILALGKSKEVIPCFIYDSAILKKSAEIGFRLDFLNQSLLDLDKQLKSKKSSLQIFYGNPAKIIEEMITEHEINALFSNIDFSSYSKNRDKKTYKICQEKNIDFVRTLDFLLHNPNEIKTNDGNPYTVFSHFFKKAKQFPVRKISKNDRENYSKERISKERIFDFGKNETKLLGGRENGIHILKNLNRFKEYSTNRDYPGLENTTKISSHNRFGTVSIREVFHSIVDELGYNHALVSQIYWREFFNHILYHFPESKTNSFKIKFRNIRWQKSKKKFEAWCQGKTGFPIIDAGMRELNATGFMHNRVRMIVASFLTKDLHIDWRWGEKFFSKKLIDYDPAVNAGNWQWAASTGCDAVPYFRIFNPWRQQEKFDPDCIYIKRWVPELQGLTSKEIHNLWNSPFQGKEYPNPMLNHKIEADKSKEIFKFQ